MITLKSDREIDLIRHASQIVSETHLYLKDFLKEGITTKELDDFAGEFIISKGGIPACKGFEGFPANICISVNEEVVHGIGGKRKLKNGDIVTLDIVVLYKGYNGDSAWTYPVGEVDAEKEYLMEHTLKSLLVGLEQIKPGARLGDVSNAIEEYAIKHKLSVVRELTGHGIGTNMHEDPDIPNYGRRGTGPVLKKGMVLAIEPMLNLGRRDIYVLEDDWTIITRDNKPSAHYEHTVSVTEDGYEILTKRLD
ncbi:MAG: type I methionyl aminopeptidase [Bacilli bacterium]